MNNIGKAVKIKNVMLYNNNVLELYDNWESPNVIISDGGYGISGFCGDANDPTELQSWYIDHIKSWSKKAKPGTTLWFWNTEIGWAMVHPILEQNGWDYVCCNIWNKGLNHIAGNCNLPTLKHFPIVTEICVQYVRRPEFEVDGKQFTLKEWLRYEWERSGIPLYESNKACGLANAATRKYLTKCHLWYAPPGEHFENLVNYANKYGRSEGKPYFSINGKDPLGKTEYNCMFAKFYGVYGITNVWEHPPLHNGERVKMPDSSKYAHLNQKPIKLIKTIIEVSSDPNDMIWEPFGGLFTVGLAAYLTNKRAVCAEIDEKVFKIAVERINLYATDLLSNIDQSEVVYAASKVYLMMKEQNIAECLLR